MRGHDFSGEDLHGRDFREQDLRNCRFVGCDLRGCDFRGARLDHADLTDANLAETRFLGAAMMGAVGAVRRGGPLLSIIGLAYPIVIDGETITFKCSTIDHRKVDALARRDLIRMDREAALRFADIGHAMIEHYRSVYVSN